MAMVIVFADVLRIQQTGIGIETGIATLFRHDHVLMIEGRNRVGIPVDTVPRRPHRRRNRLCVRKSLSISEADLVDTERIGPTIGTDDIPIIITGDRRSSLLQPIGGERLAGERLGVGSLDIRRITTGPPIIRSTFTRPLFPTRCTTITAITWFIAAIWCT